MNIDERLDRLTERHEGLTQSIELLTLDVRDLTNEVRGLTKEWDRRFGQIVTSIESLVRIAESHENRLDNLEGA